MPTPRWGVDKPGASGRAQPIFSGSQIPQQQIPTGGPGLSDRLQQIPGKILQAKEMSKLFTPAAPATAPSSGAPLSSGVEGTLFGATPSTAAVPAATAPAAVPAPAAIGGGSAAAPIYTAAGLGAGAGAPAAGIGTGLGAGAGAGLGAGAGAGLGAGAGAGVGAGAAAGSSAAAGYIAALAALMG